MDKVTEYAIMLVIYAIGLGILLFMPRKRRMR